MPWASVSEKPTRVSDEYLNGGLRSVSRPSSSVTRRMLRRRLRCRPEEAVPAWPARPAYASLAMPTRRGRAGLAGAAGLRVACDADQKRPCRLGRRGRLTRRLRCRPEEAVPAWPARPAYASLAMPTRRGRAGLAGAAGLRVACDADQKRPCRLGRRGRLTHGCAEGAAAARRRAGRPGGDS